MESFLDTALETDAGRKKLVGERSQVSGKGQEEKSCEARTTDNHSEMRGAGGLCVGRVCFVSHSVNGPLGMPNEGPLRR